MLQFSEASLCGVSLAANLNLSYSSLHQTFIVFLDASQSYSSDFASAIAGDVHGGSSPSSSSKKSRKNKNKSKRWRLFDQLRR